MPIAVKTFPALSEAASALAGDRSARFLAGGTLVMRALNEGDVSISTVVRSTDRAFAEIRPAGARIVLGAGVTMSQILANRELAFLHPVARAVGGPAVRGAATVGGNLFAPAPYGDMAAALLALDATVQLQGGYGGREMLLEEFLGNRDRQTGVIVASVAIARPAGPDAFRFRKVSRVKPKGHLGPVDRAHLPLSGGRIAGRASPTGDGADSGPGQGGGAGAGRARPSTRPASPRRSPSRPRARRPRTMRSPAPGTAARCCPCI
jgi:CO/xanthine dehydrogenase FAD-binding subunit